MAKYKLFSFDKISSTQTYAHDMIAAGRGADHIAITAQAQSAGRGRYRRTWVSHHGNLYVSFIFDAPNRDARISYAVAVAVAETLAAFGANPAIKWPNDVLLDGAKVAGILIEYVDTFVIVGIGINIHSNPTVSANYKTTRLDKYADASPADVLARLMQNLDAWRDAGFDTVRTQWMRRAAGLNQVVQYRGAPAQLIGINAAGALQLRRAGEVVSVYGDEILL